jgi:hypothetical protein
LEAAKFSESFALSIVVGDDIVSRLSVPAFEGFKETLIQTIKECKAPKYRILVGGCWYWLMGGIPSLTINETSKDGSSGGGANNVVVEDDVDIRSDTSLLQRDIEQPNYHTYVSLALMKHALERESITRCPMFLPGL